MRKILAVLVVIVILLAAWELAFTGTPLFGRNLELKNIPVTSIDLTMPMRREITTSTLCSEVLLTMQKSKNAGSPCFCKYIGSLTLHFADGSTNRFEIMPGHRFNQLDFVDVSGSCMYSISKREMFTTLEHVGLLTNASR